MPERTQRKRVTQFPVMEEINLMVTAQKLPIPKGFLFIKRIIFNIQWASATVLYSTFGVDAALTKGLQIKYADRLILPHGIKTNAEFGEFMYDLRVDSDETAVAKLNSLTARLSFLKFTRSQEGLRIDPDRELFIVVQDNLSGSSNTHIAANIQGWRFV